MKFSLQWYNYVLFSLGQLHSNRLSTEYNIEDIYMEVF